MSRALDGYIPAGAVTRAVQDRDAAPVSIVRIGLVIVNYNAGENLQRCLSHVVAQQRPADRIIVVDNASNDGSIDTVAERFPGVEVLRNSENVGFAAANNQAVDHLNDCTHAALLNPDAFPEPGWLAALEAAAAGYPDCASFASCMLAESPSSRLDGLGDAYHISGYCWRIGHGRPYRSGVVKADSHVFGACAGAAMYDLRAFRTVGGFDTTFFCYVEDVDLAYRLRLAGLDCRLVADAVVRHVGSATSGVRSAFVTYHGHRNVVWVMVKNTPMVFLWFMLPLHVFASAAALIVAAARGQAAVVLRAKLDALRGLPEMRRKRRSILASRQVGLIALWCMYHILPFQR
jgi:GT2 family glycosyltransferase